MSKIELTTIFAENSLISDLNFLENNIPSDCSLEDREGVRLEESIEVGNKVYNVCFRRNDWNSVMSPPDVPNPQRNYHVSIMEIVPEHKGNGRQKAHFENVTYSDFNEALNTYWVILSQLKKQEKEEK